MRRSKYRAVPTVFEGIKFHSKAEAWRWSELRLLQTAHIISKLERQVPYKLFAQGGGLIGSVIVDFRYREKGKLILDDTKGFQTPLSKWKFKHLSLQYDAEVRINGKPIKSKRK